MTKDINVQELFDLLPDDFPKENIVQPDDKNGFACKGCGMLCCNDKQILITPPEYIRIAWALAKDEKLKNYALREGVFASVHVGSRSGMPVMMIRNVPLFPNSEEQLGLYCPFFSPFAQKVGDYVNLHGELGRCSIHDARPGVCRIYPYGTVRLADSGDPVFYTKVEHCPGFEPIRSGDLVVESYKAPGDETVAQWVEAQRPAELTKEVMTYHKKVSSPFMEAGLHAREDGLIKSDAAVQVLTSMFYNSVPQEPENPADEHNMIVAWIDNLAGLKDDMVEFYNNPQSGQKSGR